MHLENRIRYKIVNQQYLVLTRSINNKIQVVTFYVPDFESLIDGYRNRYILTWEVQYKMYNDYPIEMFGGDICEILLNEILNEYWDLF